MIKIRVFAVLFLIIGVLLGHFVYTSQMNPDSDYRFKLGLDLSGGTHLVYTADTSSVEPSEVKEAMSALRDVIERRTNLFGVSEPIVQVERGSVVGGRGSDERLIVELPGITDVDEAVALIGETPLLEFKVESDEVEINADAGSIDAEGFLVVDPADLERQYQPTGLTGRYVQRATLQFDQFSSEPVVHINFDSEGSDLFEEITSEHTGKVLAIFLDGIPISLPVIQQKIVGGNAVISGSFDPEAARLLVRDLNYGALPLPIALEGTQSIGAALGSDVLAKGINAGVWGLGLVALFLILWYRLPGVVSVVSLSVYILIMLSLFKVIPVTLTAAGLAGFILSIGMAVDANILIFERIRDEFRNGTTDIDAALRNGFKRAWLPIRDGNISSILTAIVLFWFGTSLVEGFALVFGLGVLISMITAITVTRAFLLAFGAKEFSGVNKFLFGSGLK